MTKHDRIENKKKAPWPTKEAMEQVYAMKLWGGSTSDFYSGAGSHLHNIVQPYTTALVSFLESFNIPLTVCDLGCGDFNVGKQLVEHTKKYIAVDIVKSLIERNKENFKESNLEFQCMDITSDALPAGDCALLRQVLQHLSNAEVQQILDKITAFKYVVVTEHIPDGDFIPNKDIISGQGIRLKKQSGLNILAAPFNFKIKEEKQLVSVRLNDCKGMIITTCYTLF